MTHFILDDDFDDPEDEDDLEALESAQRERDRWEFNLLVFSAVIVTLACIGWAIYQGHPHG